MPIPFTKPANLLGRFAVVKPWPDIQAAEDENIARLQITARSLGLECIVVDPEGVCLDCPEKRVDGRDVDFVISLHFETPKAYDAFSFVALWNPLRFFKDWGYRRYSKNLLTHDDFLSCSSTWADHHIRRMIAEDEVRRAPHFTMYHSLSEPIFEPALGHGKIFYAGINWDKLGKKKGRHQDLLLMLDKAGILRIYGPKIFNNVNVWEDYKCYVGPVPFDGVSMVKAISETGIALVFSSDAHKESELMSNRLFESLAAGAVIICDDNPFARRHFGDTLLYVDASDSLESVAKQITARHLWIRKHPQEALQMARAAQAIFKEKFTLDRSLAAIYNELTERKQQLAAGVTPRNRQQVVNAFLLLPDYAEEALTRLLDSVETQTHPALQTTLLVDAGDYARHGEKIAQRLAQFPRPIETKAVTFYERRSNGTLCRRLPLGRVLAPVVESLPLDSLFITLTPNERWFSGHVGNLLRALESAPESNFAFSTSILRHVNKGRNSYNLLEGADVKQNTHLPPGFGRFLLRRSSLTSEQFDLMCFLDMRALSPFLARGKGAATGRATCLVRIQEPFVTGELLDDVMEQCIIEDRFQEIEPPSNLLGIQAALAHPGLVTSLQTAAPTTFQSVLLRLQASEGADAHLNTLRQLRHALLYELFHHEPVLARLEHAAARLPQPVMADAVAEVMASEKCDTLLAYWVGLHLHAKQRPLEALRAFNRALTNTQDSLPAQYVARAALKAAAVALQLNQIQLAEKALKEVVLKLQPSNQQALALLDKMAGKPAAAVPSVKPISNKSPLVSAIVSVYNSEKFLRGCLEDLEAQTIAGELEIIVVDTASSQNERTIVEEFQKRFTNIVYLRTERRETVYGAWNRGIKATRGKYITSANTDDRHRHDALEKLARTLDQNPDITLAYADCLITAVENETFATTKATRKFQWLDFNAQDLLTKGCFCGPQPMWRREVHQEHGYFDAEFVSAGDYEFWLKIARTRKFLHVKEVLGLYLESPASVEHSNAQRASAEVLEAKRRYGKEIMPAQAAPQANPIIMPPCGKVGKLTAARELFQKKDFRAAWDSTLVALAQRPYHPEAWLLLAEIALAAGDGNCARQCAQQAKNMAPDWDRPRKFLKGNLRGQAKHPWMIKPAPAAQPRLTVCLIARNEEKFIGQCLASVKNIASQIVVVDTGSTDRTIEIAQEHGAEIHRFEWCDDFSAARNAALEHATGDWVLILDADEELPLAQAEILREEMRQPGTLGLRLPIVSAGREQEGCSYVPRLFRNAPGLFFIGRVHEQAFSSIQVRCQQWGLKHALGKATLLHHGYTPEVVAGRNKVERNLRLLKLALEELPGEPNLLMSLGLELVRSGELTAGLDHYWKAFHSMAAKPEAEVTPELRETLLTQLTTHLLAAKRFPEIIQLWQMPFAKSAPLTASQHFGLGLAYLESKQPAEAAEQMRQCLAKRSQATLSPINPEIFKAGPHHCLAMCLTSLKEFPTAREAYEAALAADPTSFAVRFDVAQFKSSDRPVEALKLLNQLASEMPSEPRVWQLGAQIALSRPDYAAFACDWTCEAVKNFPNNGTILLQRAEALMLNQQLDEALPIWKAVSVSSRQRAALALCELVTGGDITLISAEDELAISQEAIHWYRQWIRYAAHSVLFQVHERMEKIRLTLPRFVQIWEKANQQARLAA